MAKCEMVINQNYDDLLENWKRYYEKSKEVYNKFGGPSVYFHLECIKECRGGIFLGNKHLELIYATLVSWGMHRMGNTNSQMVNFNTFTESITKHTDFFNDLKGKSLLKLEPKELEDCLKKLENVFTKLKVSNSKNAIIVANSKVIHHILPNLLLPIDRQYTIRFFTRIKDNWFSDKSGKYKLVSIPRKEKQYDLFKKIVYKSYDFFKNIELREFEINQDTFNTSYPKILDNLIVAYVRMGKKDLIQEMKSQQSLHQ